MRQYWRFLFFFLCIHSGLGANTDVPCLQQGRFRPLDSAARLWLYEHCHRQVPNSDFTEDSAEELLWQLHFEGSKSYKGKPLFWIQRAELKGLLGLPLKESRFSHQQLDQAFRELTRHPELWQRILTQQFLIDYHSPANRGRAEMLELAQLSPGLWLGLRQGELRVIAAGNTSPWDQLRPQSLIKKDFHALSLRDAKRDQALVQEALELMAKLESFAHLKPPSSSPKKTFYAELKAEGYSPQEIHQQIEAQYPLARRLQEAGSLLQVLPSRLEPGRWLSLHALDVEAYDAGQDRWVPVGNFTPYPDESFTALRKAHQKRDIATIKKLLAEAYPQLAGQVYRQARSKSLSYPSVLQLRAERAYYQYPLIEGCILLYVLACVILAFGRSKGLQGLGMGMMVLAFLLHTAILALRCFILERPPVANMFETVIYVPWITMLASFLFSWKAKGRGLLLTGAISSVALLILLRLTNVNTGMDNVQAVLDSQYWLTVHVLMIVASYGIFLLSGALAHVYLIPKLLRQQVDDQRQVALARSILQTLYLGTALLIPATILGGVWAAESWGRFWDWDPKESWAFISSCIYLIGIHAYRYRQIADRGLAVMAIIGLMSISFTWYGVNYILGTGLHSYGFGSGGESYYYLYLAAETLLIGMTLWPARARKHPQRN